MNIHAQPLKVAACGLMIGAFLVVPGNKIAFAESHCDFRDELEKLNAVAGATTSENGGWDELTIRRSILGQVLDCSTEEAKNLEGKLRNLSLDSDLEYLGNRVLAGLETAALYYENQKLRIPDLGLAGARSFAKNLRDWRAGNYAPFAQTGERLALWSNNQRLFETARTRFRYVGQAVQVLKLTDNEEIQNLFKAAEKRFATARGLNQEAKEGFRAGLEHDESLGRIKASLQALSETYEAFFALSESVQKILPHQ